VGRSSRALSPALLDEAFPFHLVLNRELLVVQAGPSARKMHPAGVVGLPLAALAHDRRLWRMAIVSLGAMVFLIGVWLWVSDAVEAYRNLPD